MGDGWLRSVVSPGCARLRVGIGKSSPPARFRSARAATALKKKARMRNALIWPVQTAAHTLISVQFMEGSYDPISPADDRPGRKAGCPGGARFGHHRPGAAVRHSKRLSQPCAASSTPIATTSGTPLAHLPAGARIGRGRRGSHFAVHIYRLCKQRSLRRRTPRVCGYRSTKRLISIHPRSKQRSLTGPKLLMPGASVR